MNKLRDCLEAEDPEARAAAVRTLGARGEAAALDQVSHPDPQVRLAVVQALDRQEDRALAERLLGPLAWQDPSIAVRSRALRAFGRRGRFDLVLDAARASMDEQAGAVRLAALAALGHHHDQEEAARLLRARLDAGDLEAARAATLLARGGDRRGIRILARLLLEAPSQVAATAAIGASQVGEPMRQALLAALDRPEADVRMHAAAALHQLEDPAAEATLLELADEPGRVGLDAALLLGEDQPEATLLRLLRALEEEDPMIRATVASRSPWAPDGLGLARRALADPSAHVRIAAAGAVLTILSRER
jgi:HEAT repeat protein